MADETKKRKRRKAPRQDWKPHWSIALLYRIWMVVFTLFKIAAGAAATVLLVLVICVFVFVGTMGDYLQEDILPFATIDTQTYDQSQNSYLYYLDADGQVQISQKIFAEVSSEWASYKDIPKDMINAAISIEDHRFYEHQGVDWVTTIKACARMFFGDDSVGGSSITQQLIKNLLLKSEDETADDVTVQRKVLEIFRAVQMEKSYDKETILEWYLNLIYLGQGCEGVRSAAETYFGKELEMLTTAECASIISITNSPTYFDPYQNFENNKERKEDVLFAMKNHGWISQDEYDQAIAQELVFKSRIDDGDRMTHCPNTDCGYKNIRNTFVFENDEYYCPNCGTLTPVTKNSSQEMYSWYTDTVLEDVAMAFAERDGIQWNDSARKLYMQQIQTGGYHIYTCLDMDVQNQVDAIYTNLDEIPDTRGGQQLQSAIVIVDNRTGDIVAMAGGVGEKEYFDELNRAVDSKRQSGSSIKPLSIYAPAFESGSFSPATIIKDLPLNYDDGPWPRNDDRNYSYSRTILSGIISSVNAVAANTLDLIGTNYGYEFAKNKFGLSTLIDEYVDGYGTVHSDNDYSPLAMGAQTFGVTVRDMTNAFATFANNGVYREGRTFTKVYDSEGNLVLDNAQNSREILSEKTIDYMNYCLVNATRTGTGYEANLSYSHGITTAGKTGTTADKNDRWYCGYTGYYTAAVWCGFEWPEEINLVGYGVNNPSAYLWKKVMAPLHVGKSDIPLYNYYNFTSVKICVDSGLLATEACENDVRTTSSFDRVEEVLVYREDAPKEFCDKHVLVEYCTVGGGVATEYCKHFAEVDEEIVIEEMSLLKLTRDEVDEIFKAEDYRLYSEYLLDSYVYLIDDDGDDAVWKGFHRDINEDVDAPYMICPMHTKEAWETYLEENKDQPTIPTDPTTPIDPVPVVPQFPME